MDTKLERIKISLEGQKSQIDSVIEQLVRLEKDLKYASIPDRDGFYQVEQQLLHLIFPTHLSIAFLKNLLTVHGYSSETQEFTLFTEANFLQVQELYTKASRALKNSPTDQNKDIQRFLSIFEIKTGKDQNLLLQNAVENEILQEIDGIYKFKIDPQDAYEKMNIISNALNESNLVINVEESEDLEYLREFAFDGGKVVFVQDGEELEHSPFDIQDESMK